MMIFVFFFKQVIKRNKQKAWISNRGICIIFSNIAESQSFSYIIVVNDYIMM